MQRHRHVPIAPLFAAVVACGLACNAKPDQSANTDDSKRSPDVAKTAPLAPNEVLAPAEKLEPNEPRCAAGAPPTAPVPIDPTGDIVQGSMRVKRGDELVGLPLQETTFDTLVVGTVAETSVVQVFGNPFDQPIEAIYVFPLPDDGAVDDYWMHVGDRHIHGVMKERGEARKIYEQAREQGKSAGLLEQERPNIFTQSIANIPPGESIKVEMHVVQPLQQDDGVYTLVLPTVVGPRFIPGKPTGAGPAPDTDRVPDGSKISPPITPEGTVTCARVSFTVNVDAGMPALDLESKFHTVKVSRDGDTAFVELADGTAIPNRDFELSWRLAGDRPQASLMAQRETEGGYFTLTVQPPARAPTQGVVPRELIFVVDNSGSMGGAPIEAAKAAMRKSLTTMRQDDAFMVIRFSESASALGAEPLPNTPENLERGLAYVDAMSGMGGTQMVEGIKAALEMPGKPGKMRIVLFMTDGFIGNEEEIFQAIAQRIGETRLFSMGVGSSVNRYLLDGMSKVGRGAVTYMAPGEQPDALVERFYSRIAHPVLTDIAIDWKSLDVHDVVPARIPDLFAGQPVVVFGRFNGNPSGQIALRGRLGGEQIELPLTVDFANSEQASGLSSMWARKHIDDLMGYPNANRRDADSAERIKKQVIEVALAYRVMTKYTSFVAVDESRVANPDGTYETVQQPVEMPEDVSYEGIMGGFGSGGGGTGWGTIGTGRYGVIGHGSGTGSGYGKLALAEPSPAAGAPSRHRLAATPRASMASVKVTGELDKNVVRRYLRRSLPRIKYCYEKELINSPKLAGQVVIQFVISPKGKVLQVKVTGLGNKSVESCVAQAVKAITFPQPKGGGVVKVELPVKFSSR